MVDKSVEDILSGFLESLGEAPVTDNDSIRYGSLNLSVARKEGKANTLLADRLFSPSLLLAERIERSLVPATGSSVVELGVGCALPSLLMATLAEPPSVIVVTDHPDKTIFENLERNVNQNRHLFQSGCSVHCQGYEWGQDVGGLLRLLPSNDTHPRGFDVVIMSDLLHFDASRDLLLLLSLKLLLSKAATSRVYVAVGNYTKATVCDNFLREGERIGMIWEEGENNPTEADWHGTPEVTGLDRTQLAARKSVCRWWLGRWAKI